MRSTALKTWLCMAIAAGMGHSYAATPGEQSNTPSNATSAYAKQRLPPGLVLPLGNTVLYDQFVGSPDSGLGSYYFTGAKENMSTQLADDFIVPDGISGWRITGFTFKGPKIYGEPSSWTLQIYKDGNGKPGRIVLDNELTPDWIVPGEGDDFTAYLKSSLKLKPGTYWVSMAARYEVEEGTWFWNSGAPDVGVLNQPALRNPGLGWAPKKCATWKPILSCFGVPFQPVLFFKVIGVAQ